MQQMLASFSCYPSECGDGQKVISNNTGIILILSFRCTSWGVSCILLLNALSCVLLISFTGNSISFSGHPLCCSCSMVSQRLESGSPALVKLSFLHQAQPGPDWMQFLHVPTLILGHSAAKAVVSSNSTQVIAGSQRQQSRGISSHQAFPSAPLLGLQ